MSLYERRRAVLFLALACLLAGLACSQDPGVDRSSTVRTTSMLGGSPPQETAHYRVVVPPQFDWLDTGLGGSPVYDPVRKQFSVVHPDTLTFDARGWSLSAPAAGTPAVPFATSQTYDPSRRRALRFAEQDMWAWDGSRWSVRESSGPKPPTRTSALTMYDPNREHTLLYGGFLNSKPLSDTWLWNGAEWGAVTSEVAPPLRSFTSDDYAAIYDVERKRTVFVVPNGASLETYLFDGVTWTRAAGESPPFRKAYAFVWDGSHRSGFLFGGVDARGVDMADSWRWDGSKWTNVTPAVSPPARAVRGTGRLVFDPEHDKLVLIGGAASERSDLLDDTWIWDGASATWTEAAKAGPRPPGRYYALIGYDPDRKGVVLSGGLAPNTSSGMLDTWFWDGATWTESGVFAAPPSRTTANFVDLPASSASLLFGGISGADNSVLGDTWLWDGEKWSTPTVSSPPPARVFASMTYDSTRSLALLFGGVSDTYQILADSWTWANSTWTPVTGPRPPARYLANLVFDRTNARAVLFGGRDPSNRWIASGWQWDGTTWTALPGPQPPPRAEGAMVYDPKRGNIVLFGGASGSTASSILGDTWILAGETWTQVTSTPSPPPRAGMHMAFDPARENIVLFGGQTIDPDTGIVTYFDDTWTWDGTAWTNLSVPGPPARANGPFVYDSDRRRLVLIGGTDADHFWSDTWAWDGTKWTTATSSQWAPIGSGASAVYDPRKKEVVIVPDTNIAKGFATYTGLTYLLSLYGQACGSGDDCAAGSCVDGVCCFDSTCASCERCSDPSGPGVCRSVTNAEDADSCDGTSTCNADGACRLQLGASCSDSRSCGSSFCVDGVCCEKKCDGQCEACAEPGSEGRCQPIRGKPRGERPDCAGASSGGDAGTGSLCDRPACNGGLSTPLVGDRCQGTIGPCAPFACSLEGCRSRCASDDDCDATAFCDSVIGSCRPRLTCDGDHTLVADGLASQSCEPYRCAKGEGCRTSCSSIADCVAPSECSREGQCVAPLTTSSDGSCAVTARSIRRPGGGIGGGFVTLAILAMARRRRRARGPRMRRGVAPVVAAAVFVGCSTHAPSPSPSTASTTMELPHIVDPVVSTAVWENQPAVSPQTTGAMFGAAMAYDSSREELVLLSTRNTSERPITLVLDSGRSGWSMHTETLALGSAMATRRDALLFDDPVSHKVILFGGTGWFADLNDTWRWDGFRWSHPPTRGPSPPQTTTADGPAVYHELAKRTVIWTPSGAWMWNGSDWMAPPIDPGPSARRGVTMGYDATRGQIVLFGGRDAATQQLLDDTWLFDGTSWAKAEPTKKPPPREGAAIAFDLPRRQLVMFGGTPVQGDTWTWNGSTWTEAQATTRPSPRRDVNVFRYDPDREVVVLAGGYDSGTGTVFGDTWTWNGAWTRRSDGPARYGSASGFDRAGRRLVVTGGASSTSTQPDARTWTWNGQSWSELTQDEPPPRAAPAIAYDAARGNVVMFGGATSVGSRTLSLADTWTWAGRWKQETTPAALSGRAFASMVYDAHARSVVLFGGIDWTGSQPIFRGDTWVWNGAWSPATTSPSPAPGAPVLIHDEARQNVFLFEGADGASTAPIAVTSNTSWTWDGTTWHRVDSPQMPSPRSRAAIAYDRAHQQIVLFGGVDPSGAASLDDTWIWNGTEWSSPRVPGPSGRGSAWLVYDDAHHELLLFGGRRGFGTEDVYDDTWTWDGQTWAEKPQTGTKPSPLGTLLAYDPQVGRVVATAGANTWTWNGSAWSDAGGTTYSAPDGALVYDEGRGNLLRFGGRASPFMLANTATLTFRGAGCQTSAECNQGGFCVDGVCCVQASCASCERCDSADRPGVCTPVVDADDPDTCTNGRTCNASGRCGLLLGSACGGAVDCASGYCVDGVCCDSACDGQCEACNTSAVGLCRPSKGKPRGTRPACPGAEAAYASACDVPACDGTDAHRQSCQGTIGPCAPYVCGESGCSTSCASNADCDPSATCDVNAGRCRTSADAICLDEHTLFRGTDSTTVDCRPFTCAGNACLTRCTSVNECVSPNECSRDGVCVPPLPETRPEDLGCAAVRPGASSTETSAGAATILVVAILALRRRRRTPRGETCDSGD